MSLAVLLVQIAVILVVARIVGWVFGRFGQPQVVGEMAAGILLGPSLLGWLAPDVSAFIFPPESLDNLGSLSQVGLLLFMFLVGLEFDPKLLRGRGHAALVTSHASIIVPFFLGSLLALHLYPRLSDESVRFDGFALFLGAAMSVTAFPVLARILAERGLLKTKMGAVTIACAAVDDVTAWAILAVVIALVRASAAHAPLWVTLAGTVVYVMVMLLAVHPALRWLERRHDEQGKLDRVISTIVFIGLLASAWTTEQLGVHALFGAFCFGAVMPKARGFVHDLTERLEDVTVLFLLPLFFASAGLRTQIGLVDGAEMWSYFGLIMLVAVGGKFGGSAIAARLSGLDWRESSALGILMNTRGLMELVILTIGLEIGVISPALFAMMVMMALATTMMTTPILGLLYPSSRMREQESEPASDETRVLVPVALPSTGPGLLRVAHALASELGKIYPLHLRAPGHVLHAGLDDDTPPDEEHALRPLVREAEALGVSVRPLVFVAPDAAGEIVELARIKRAQWVVMGWHRPLLTPLVTHGIVGGTVHEVLEGTRAGVAIHVERHHRPWRRVLVPIRDDPHDRSALDVALALARRDRELRLRLLDIEGANGDALALISDPELVGRVEVVRAEGAEPMDAVVRFAEGCDLVALGVSRTWGLERQLFGIRHERLLRETSASLLLVRAGGVSASPVAERAVVEHAA
ncbi:MAG: cation:proton antiporter [Myxococcales bacterium]|nr:cation:proton antiporter [Myxococcales bacterium]